MAPPPDPTVALPHLVLGSAPFNSQYNHDPSSDTTSAIVNRALECGITGFDTSPYYGPAESFLGAALAATNEDPDTDPLEKRKSLTTTTTKRGKRIGARRDCTIFTKVGRESGTVFKTSPQDVRRSVRRSLNRLRSGYVDGVFVHDVEFVSVDEVVDVVVELRRIRDRGRAWLYHDAGDDDNHNSGDDDNHNSGDDGHDNIDNDDNDDDGDDTPVIGLVGISGYPLDVLTRCALWVKEVTGEPLDMVQTYSHYSLLNQRLDRPLCLFDDIASSSSSSSSSLSSTATQASRSAFEVLTAPDGAAVALITNSSILGLGLLRSDGLPAAMVGWHPAPPDMRRAVDRARSVLAERKSLSLLSSSLSSSPSSFGDCDVVEPIALEDLALWYSFWKFLRNWFEDDIKPAGDDNGGGGGGESGTATRLPPTGMSVIGVSSVSELDATMVLYNAAIADASAAASAAPDHLDGPHSIERTNGCSRSNGRVRLQPVKRLDVDETTVPAHTRAFCRLDWRVKASLADEIRKTCFGEWADVSWQSPPPGWERSDG